MAIHRQESQFRIANAPCSWGVEDPGNPDNPPWQQVLDEASKAGYKGLELGPYGFLPTDHVQLRDELGIRELTISAGTIFEPLWDEEQRPFILQKTRKICQLLNKLGSEYLVVIDSVNGLRSSYAGLKDLAPRLDNYHWEIMMSTIRQISDIAHEYCIKPVLHPHAGGYIEYADEVTRAMEDLFDDTISLCLDTGHCVYADMDPVHWLKQCKDRLAYVHFKDVRAERLKHCIDSRMGFWDACKYGVMCPIGEGCVDYPAVKQALTEINYRGWIVIEQERDPKAAGTSLEDVSKSLNHLRQSGFC
ncbi:TIM barrel protein [Endozoicomonas atrinae]|uniref:TIM barrel protein n=1 Tax=Endozoicomonas atrinae TaxID=1333660 RepID=UPI000824972F|nr:TIM barrel protein [Endozoicomonas atrinae]